MNLANEFIISIMKMHVSMCMYACMDVCMCLWKCMCVCVFLCVCIRMHVHVPVCTHTLILAYSQHKHAHILHACTCTHTHHTCTHTHAHTHTHTHTRRIHYAVGGSLFNLVVWEHCRDLQKLQNELEWECHVRDSPSIWQVRGFLFYSHYTVIMLATLKVKALQALSHAWPRHPRINWHKT